MKKAGIIVSGVMALMFAAIPMHADILTNGPNGWASGVPGADPEFGFIVSIGSDTGFGVVSATDEGRGMFLATVGILTVTGGSDVGTYSLVAAGAPGGTFSPSGAFIFDNLFAPASDPTLDGDGLLFAGGGLEINIWGNSPDNYSFWSFDGGGYNVADTDSGSVTFFATSPEPSALVLLGSLLVGLGIIGRKKTQSQQ
jgi:hypothetical protein